MPVIPLSSKDAAHYAAAVNEKIQQPTTQKRIILIIVCVALLLDNMLYMVIVPIIPDFLMDIWNKQNSETVVYQENAFVPPNNTYENKTFYNGSWHYEFYGNMSYWNYTSGKRKMKPLVMYANEDGKIGVLFASKAIIQLMVNPITGTIIDRIGYDIPMMIGLMIMFLSTAVFAFGQDYATLFVARSLQGIGSAFADTSGLAMIADRFTEEQERSKALGIALAFISFGSLFAPPFGGFLYQFAGKCVPFLLLATVALIDGFILILVMRPIRKERKETQADMPKGTPIYRLLMDPFIACAAGALAMSNVSLAFLEPTIAIWMKQTMDTDEWEMGLIWLPAFFPHVFGVYLTVKLAKAYPQYQWLLTAIGLTMEGLSCLIIPFCKAYFAVIIPIMIICFGIALVDTAMLPLLGNIVDVRYVSIYGSVYAIVDISYSLAYAFGPIVAGNIVHAIGFTWLNVGICISNVVYAPLLFALRKIYTYKPFENECDVLVDSPPSQKYKTYMMNSIDGTQPTEVQGQKNHLDYGKHNQMNDVNSIYGKQEHDTSRIIDTDSDGDFRPY